jgi:hypothetical protein
MPTDWVTLRCGAVRAPARRPRGVEDIFAPVFRHLDVRFYVSFSDADSIGCRDGFVSTAWALHDGTARSPLLRMSIYTYRQSLQRDDAT